jgi:hypothetical protein
MLTNEIILEYEAEINKFWETPDCKELTYGNRDLILMTYERLCEKLPFNPFTIVKDKVYLNGEIELAFIDALYYAIAETCRKYNNKEFFIRYE